MKFEIVVLILIDKTIYSSNINNKAYSNKIWDRAMFIKGIADEWYPKAKKIKLVMDNFKTHDPSAFYETFEPAEAKRLWDRFEFIYTPKHGSWLNMAEIELYVLNGQCLNRLLSRIEKIKGEVDAWPTNRNNKNRKINWQFTNKKARVKLKKLYPSILAKHNTSNLG